MRHDGAIEGALPVKHHVNTRNNKNKKGKKHQGSNGEYTTINNKSKVGTPSSLRLDTKCTKCNQMGHETIICKNKNQQHGEEAQVAEQKEDQLFVATCFSAWNQVRVGSLTVVALTT
ncbi:hypothetical protein AAG906_023838 [Vitis piasezkii]